MKSNRIPFLFFLAAVSTAHAQPVNQAVVKAQKSKSMQTVPSDTFVTSKAAKAKYTLKPVPLDLAKMDQYFKTSSLYLSAVPTPGSVVLTWSYAANSKGYNLYFRTKSGGQYKKLNSKPIADGLSDQDANLLLESLMPVNTGKDPVEGVNWIYEMKHILTVLSQAMGYRVQAGSIPFSDSAVKPALRYLATMYYPIALVIGQAYEHKIAGPGIFEYKVVYLDPNGVEKDFVEAVTVVTEEITPLPGSPTGLTATAGDTKALLLWNDPPAGKKLNGYSVYRAASATGSYKRVNLAPVLVKMAVDLKGDSLKPPRYGYADTALVNSTTYYYTVAARGELGGLGSKSAVVSVKPVDMTPPQMPQNINITAAVKSTLVVSWKVVRYDILNRAEKVKRYRVYRYPDYATAVDTSSKDSGYFLGFLPQPKIPVVVKISQTLPPPLPPTITVLDKDTCFVDSPPEAEKAYWYRISCEDSSGNIGKKSAAIYGVMPDFTPPDPPRNPTADPDTQCVRLAWQPPDTVADTTNRDLAGYLIYRGICGTDVYDKRDVKKCIVSYPLGLLKDITDRNTLEYKDCSLPKGSPICYRYVLKAYDKSQNLSVFSDSVCVRLRDKTPPETPVITALRSQNRAIRIEAVAPPVQDMKGFIVRRREDSETAFQTVYSDSVTKIFGCDDIPVSTDSVVAKKVNVLSCLDKNVKPEKVYWYTVEAFDHDGNISEPSPAVSTFTFEINNLSKPARVQARQQDCRIVLNWLVRSRTAVENFWGYVVYRSLDKYLGYRQLNGMAKKETWTDDSVVKGVTYWYRVQVFDMNGDRSPLSDPVSITVK